MSAQNETSKEQDIKRWTAKRRAALVLERLRGQPATWFIGSRTTTSWGLVQLELLDA